VRRVKLIVAILYLAFTLTLFLVWLFARREEARFPLTATYRSTDATLFQRLARWRLRTPPPARDAIVVVSFDWRATKIYGPLPYPRDVYAELVGKLRELGARTILLDPLFADAEIRQLSPGAFRSLVPALPLDEIRIVNPYAYPRELARKLDAAERRLVGELGATPGDRDREGRLAAFRAQRKELLALVSRIAEGEANAAFERVMTARRDVVFPTDYSNIPTYSRSGTEALRLFAGRALSGFEGATEIASFRYVRTLYSRLLRAGPLVGVNEVDRTEAFVRPFVISLRPLIRHEGRLFAGSVPTAVAHFLGAPLKVAASPEGPRLVLGTRSALLERDGSFPIAYYNDPDFPREVPAIEVLREKVPRSAIQGKLVIVDVRTVDTAPHLKLPTPIFGERWQSDLKATLASNLLLGHRGPTVTRPGWLEALEGLLIWLIAGAFAVLVLVRKRSLLQSLAVGFSAVAVPAAFMVALLVPGLRASLGIFVFGALFFLTATLIAHYLLQRTERAQIRRAFGFYLPAPVLEHMLKDENALRLGGERRELSILFSDIRGFTGLSERSTPEALGQALNVHLTELTEAVFAEGGTLDKYMGDCVMAFFGAPVRYDDHAARALRAALAMQARLRSVAAPVWREKCGAEAAIGVGVASGEVVVGNMGSERLFDYTVIGDNVNLASRLEGLTKVYGVDVLCAEATRKLAGERFAYLEVDRVRVKGKQEPVRIFEVVCEGAADEARRRYDAVVTAALEAYRGGELERARARFLEAASLRPEAKLPHLYLERIEALEGQPLPDGWDGVTTFDHK
jgi:class 3 adenylate cyclase